MIFRAEVIHFQDSGSLSTETHFFGPEGQAALVPGPELLYHILRMGSRELELRPQASVQLP